MRRSYRFASILGLIGLSAACTSILGDLEIDPSLGNPGVDGSADGLANADGQNNGTDANGGTDSQTGSDAPIGDGATDGPATLTISPSPHQMAMLRSQVFTASIPVDWSVQEGSPDGGLIDADGKYVSPAREGVYHIVAKSKADATITTSVTVTVIGLQLLNAGGAAAGPGTTDGPKQNAHFYHPEGIAQARTGAGGIYVADTGAHTIRKVQGGTVITIAGRPLNQGFKDGTTAESQFRRPQGIAVKDLGTKAIFVSDTENHCIRKIDPDTNITSTFSGLCGSAGQLAGAAGTARFDTPTTIAINNLNSTLYVCEQGNAVPGSSRQLVQVDAITGEKKDLPLLDINGVFAPNFQSCSLGTYDFNGGLNNRMWFGGDANSGAITFFIEGGGTFFAKAPAPDLFIGGFASDNGSGNGKSLYVSVPSKHAIYGVDINDPTANAFTVLSGDPAQLDSGIAVNGAFGAARFPRPQGMLYDNSKLFVADSSSDSIRELNFNTQQVSDFAAKSVAYGHVDANRSAARFALVTGITAGANDLAYVTDSSADGGRISSTIRQINLATGDVTTLAGLVGRHALAEDGPVATAKFGFPWDLALDGGFLYVSDLLSHAIRKVPISGTGNVTTVVGSLNVPGDTVGTGIAATLKQPGGVATDGAGTLFIADTQNFKIKKVVLATGTVTLLAGSVSGDADGKGASAQFRAPNGLAYDNGNLYVADSTDHTIRKIVVANGEVTTFIGQHGVPGFDDGGPGTHKLFGPVRLAADHLGNLYVTEGFNDDFDKSLSGTIRRIDIATRTVSAFMGKRPEFGFVPGPLTNARVNFALGLAVTPKGDLLFTDLNDYCVGIVQSL